MSKDCLKFPKISKIKTSQLVYLQSLSCRINLIFQSIFNDIITIMTDFYRKNQEGYNTPSAKQEVTSSIIIFKLS